MERNKLVSQGASALQQHKVETRTAWKSLVAVTTQAEPSDVWRETEWPSRGKMINVTDFGWSRLSCGSEGRESHSIRRANQLHPTTSQLLVCWLRFLGILRARYSHRHTCCHVLTHVNCCVTFFFVNSYSNKNVNKEYRNPVWYWMNFDELSSRIQQKRCNWVFEN